jgi:hypothetical protein
VPLAVKPETPGVAVAVHANVVPLILEVRVTDAVLVPEQIVCDNGELLIVGVGFTVIVNVFCGPRQVIPPLVY